MNNQLFSNLMGCVCNSRFRNLFLCVLWIPLSVTAEPLVSELQLRAEQWDLARHGEKILQLNDVKMLVNTWMNSENHLIELRYPGGEEGELWVQELVDWLISLGIPSQYIVYVAGSGEADVIKFKIIKAGESYR